MSGTPPASRIFTAPKKRPTLVVSNEPAAPAAPTAARNVPVTAIASTAVPSRSLGSMPPAPVPVPCATSSLYGPSYVYPATTVAHVSPGVSPAAPGMSVAGISAAVIEQIMPMCVTGAECEYKLEMMETKFQAIIAKLREELVEEIRTSARTAQDSQDRLRGEMKGEIEKSAGKVQKSVTKLREDMEKGDEKSMQSVNDFETNIRAEISAAKQKLDEALEARRVAFEGEITTINSNLTALQTSLNDSIADTEKKITGLLTGPDAIDQKIVDSITLNEIGPIKARLDNVENTLASGAAPAPSAVPPGSGSPAATVSVSAYTTLQEAQQKMEVKILTECTAIKEEVKKLGEMVTALEAKANTFCTQDNLDQEISSLQTAVANIQSKAEGDIKGLTTFINLMQERFDSAVETISNPCTAPGGEIEISVHPPTNVDTIYDLADIFRKISKEDDVKSALKQIYHDVFNKELPPDFDFGHCYQQMNKGIVQRPSDEEIFATHGKRLKVSSMFSGSSGVSYKKELAMHFKCHSGRDTERDFAWQSILHCFLSLKPDFPWLGDVEPHLPSLSVHPGVGV